MIWEIHAPCEKMCNPCILQFQFIFERDILLSLPCFVLQTSVTETSAPELAKLLYWLMVVGYSLRNIEVRFDMERVLGTPPKLAELPPGENI